MHGSERLAGVVSKEGPILRRDGRRRWLAAKTECLAILKQVQVASLKGLHPLPKLTTNVAFEMLHLRESSAELPGHKWC
jgi:hypothetical protein